MNYNRNYQNKDWLEEEYIKKGRTAPDIGRECNVGRCIINNWASKYGLIKRPKNPNSKSDYKNKRWLNEQYLIKNKTQQEIADEQGVGLHTIRRWAGKFKLYKK